MNDFSYFLDDLPFWSAPFGIKLLDCLLFKKNATVLDIGCGEGFPIIEIAARFGSTGLFLGIDPLERPLERFAFKKEQYGLPTVWAIRSVAETIPIASQTIDRIVSNNGLNNVADLDLCLAECRRIIRPDGQMVFAVNTQDTMKAFYDVLKIAAGPDSEAVGSRIETQIREKRLTEDQWRSRLQQSGFRVGKILKDSFCLSFADAAAMMDYYLIRRFFLPGWQALVDDEKRAGVFSRVESELNKQAEASGRLNLSIPFLVFDCRPDDRPK